MRVIIFCLLQGDLIQPTAVHASFAYGPLFRAIDANEKLHRQRLQQMLANVSFAGSCLTLCPPAIKQVHRLMFTSHSLDQENVVR